MTTNELIEQHVRFLSGDPGRCSLCGKEHAFAWTDQEEIEAGFGSQHDTWHFLWLDEAQERRPQGFICDACINRLLEASQIVAYCSDMSGLQPSISEGVVAIAYEMGAHRMRSILDLPVDEKGNVTATAVATLLPPLRRRRRNQPIPLWELITLFAGYLASDDDPEGADRRYALATTAAGACTDTDLSQMARAWARQRSERQARDQEANNLIEIATSGQPVEKGPSDPVVQPEERVLIQEPPQPVNQDCRDIGRPLKHHPDNHALQDWYLYGPQNSGIATLVNTLAYDHDVRLSDIEQLIDETLRNELKKRLPKL